MVTPNDSTKKIRIEEESFPSLLKEIPNPPPILHYKGNLPPPDKKMIAMVGTRKASYEGKIFAKQIARNLAESGIVVVSGLALGVDGAAHEGVLAASGITIAVLGNGLDQVYPRAHQNLASEITKMNGAIISEYEEGSPPLPHHFLERNRIISGLCIATIVIEAHLKSGALVTAKCALEQGREVFVLPGGARDPNYEGSHLLIRQGARLVTSAEEILEDLNLNTELKRDQRLSFNQGIINELQKSRSGLIIDKIIEATKLEPQAVHQELSFLLIDGIVEERNGIFKLK